MPISRKLPPANADKIAAAAVLAAVREQANAGDPDEPAAATAAVLVRCYSDDYNDIEVLGAAFADLAATCAMYLLELAGGDLAEAERRVRESVRMPWPPTTA